MDNRERSDFRVIAEGDDDLGRDLTIVQALLLADLARRRGRRFVAIVDDVTGAIVDEGKARTLHRAELASYKTTQVVDHPLRAPVSAGGKIGSGETPRVTRVLVVDNDPLFAEALRVALSDGLEVKVATDAHQALASMTAGDWYDVVLCERMMPGMTGVELRDRVHAASSKLAARFVFIDKPADVQAVCDLIRRFTLPGGDSVDTALASR
jgi:CheY-like chemotaxis protein